MQHSKSLSPASRDIILQHSPFCVLEWDAELKMIHWPKKAEEIFGWRADEVIGRPVDDWKFVHPDDFQRVREVIDNLLSGRVTSSVNQNRNLTKSGRIVVCEWYNTNVYDENDNLVSVVSMILDVTERNRIQHEILEERNKSEHLLRHMSDGYYSVDRNFVLTGANPRFESFYGSKAEILGKSLWEVAPELLSTEVPSELAKAMETQSVRILEFYLEPYNSWYKCRFIPTKDGISVFYDDISDRKRYELELIESQSTLRRLWSSGIIGIIRYHSDGTWISVNNTVLQMLGYSRDEFESRTFTWSALTPAEWHCIDDREFRRLREHGYIKPYEKEFFKKDGTRLPVIIGAANFDHIENEGIAYLLDISDQKQSEEHLRLISGASEIGFWDWNAQKDEITWTNPTILFGEVQASGAGRPTHYVSTSQQMRDRIHPDDFASLTAGMQECIRKKFEHKAHFRIVRPNGEVRWIRGSAKIFYDHNDVPYRIVGANIDITELHSALTNLQESEQRYKEIAKALEASQEHLDIAMEAGKMAAWGIDLSTGQFMESDGHHKLFGLSEPIPNCSFETFLSFIHYLDKERMRKANIDVLDGNADELSEEFRVVWPDGSIHWLYARARASRDSETGKLQKYIGAVVDITELKEINIKLQRAVSVRDDFLSVASHELRTPITSLNLQTQILERLLQQEASLHKIDSSNFERLQKHLTATQAQVKKLTSLVDDLLDVTRITNGRVSLTLEQVDLNTLVTNIVESMAEHFLTSRCEVTIHASEQLTGKWDQRRIEQVIVNLLTNACKYGKGKPVHVDLSRLGDWARIEVKDQGIGISKENQSRIFNRFERAVKGSAFSGLGLGLYISRQIIGAHGGRIFARSVEGQGSTFIVELPLTTQADIMNKREAAL